MFLIDYIQQCGLAGPVLVDRVAWDHHVAASFNQRRTVAEAVAAWRERFPAKVAA